MAPPRKIPKAAPKPLKDPGPKPDRGGVAHVATPERRAAVSAATATFMTQELIAQQMGITVKTLRKHYRIELDTALQRANATVVGRLYEMTKKSAVACFFWLQNRDSKNWKNVNRLDVKAEAPPGGSFATMVLMSVGKMPPEETAPKPEDDE